MIQACKFATLLTAILLAISCSLPNSEPNVGSESHFLTACTDTCSSGLSCRCGTCTSDCSATNECVRFNPAATCVTSEQADAGLACSEAATSSHCDVLCTATEDCASFGAQFFCERGFCRTDPLARSNEPFPGYGILCQQAAVACSTSQNPVSLVGSYAGQATAVLSSNALWGVGNQFSFTAEITNQTNLKLTGTVTLPSFTIDIQSADIRGDSPSFTAYASTFVDQNGCHLETRSVLSGVLDANVTPHTITGGLALRFTGNYNGACTQAQIEDYPSTGANFQIGAALQ